MRPNSETYDIVPGKEVISVSKLFVISMENITRGPR